MINVKNVINDLVGYDGLKIIQNSSYFNFSLESVLLPRFCEIKKDGMKIIDICTGNAPIPLILSTLTNSNIIGIEIQKEIYDLAVETVKLNNLNDKINIINMDAKDLIKIYDTDSFDLITCNPPYFKYKCDSNINENIVKSIARHEMLITLEDIIKIAKKLLKNNCSLVIVHRSERLAEILKLLVESNLQPKRMRFIYPKSGEESNLVLIDAKKNGKVGVKVLSPLVCHYSDGSYTEEVLKMFEREK